MTVSNVTKVSLVALSLAVSAPVLADDDMSYNYIEGAYIDTELEVGSTDVDGDGFGLVGSVELGENFFLTAGYGSQEFDDNVDLDQWSFGIGAHTPIADNVDLVGRVSYIDAEVDSRFGSADDDGYGIGIGLCGRITEQIELEGGINYADLDDSGDDTSFAFGGRYYFTEQFAVGAGVDIGDDVSSVFAAARFEF